MDKIYQKSVNNVIQNLSETIGVVKGLSTYEPVWSKAKKMFKKIRGKKNFEDRIPSGTNGVYRVIYEPTGVTMYIGRGTSVGGRISRHRKVFLNKGRDIKNPGGTYLPSPAGQNMFKFDRYRKNWLFSWCKIGNTELSKKYEDLLIKVENPTFNDSNLGGI